MIHCTLDFPDHLHHPHLFSELLAPAPVANMNRRGLYHLEPPALQTEFAMHATLLVSWWCTGFALAVILVRVFGRYVRTEKLFLEDKIMAASIFPLLARMGLVHVVLLWGTNNTVSNTLSTIDVQHREIGSKLVLASRITYAAFIWTAKLTVLEFLKRIVGSYWRRSYEIGLQIGRYFLLATFVAVVVATLAECQPFNHYWQVIPDPGPQCREGVAQLMTMGICDIITDVILVVYPTPIVIMSAMPVKRKLSLVLLFALSLALVGITAYRIPSTIGRDGAQQYRSLLASFEILAAAGISNSIVIGSFLRDRGAKKAKYRRESIGGSSSLDRTTTLRTTVTQQHYGSDSDLFGDVGMFLAPELQSRKSSTTSPPPRPVHPHSDSALAEKGGISRRAAEEDLSSISTNSTDLKHDLHTTKASAETVPSPFTPKKMSFFDVGSLMQSEERPRPPSSSKSSTDISKHAALHDSPRSQAHTFPREDTTPSISDLGGLLSTTRSSTDLDRSTALPPAARQRPPQQDQHPEPAAPTTPPRNFSRGGSAYRSKSRASHEQHYSPPPPSYQPRRASDTTQWNGAGAAGAMDFVDAGGLLR
jgi:hypothetical protein